MWFPGRRARVVLVAVGLVVTMVVSASSRAVAEGAWGTIVGGVPEAIVIVTRDGTLARWESGRAGGARWTCGYHRIVAPVHSVLDPSPVVDWSAPVRPEAEEHYMLACFVDDGAGGRTMVSSRYLQFDPGDPFGGVGASERALDEARRRLEIPDPDPVVNPPNEQLVGLPMWLWLDRPWGPVSTVASIGDVWAAVTAEPVLARWSFPDGHVLVCDRGLPYDIWRPAREQRSDCTHTWTRSSSSSDGGVEWVTVTMVWRVEWSAAGTGAQPLGTVERTTAFPVRVVEAQATIR